MYEGEKRALERIAKREREGRRGERLGENEGGRDRDRWGEKGDQWQVDSIT